MMKNLKLNMKLTVSFGIILLMLLFSCGVAMLNLTAMGQQIKEFSTRTVPNTGYVWQMRRNMVSVERNLLAALAEEDEKAIEEYLASAEQDAQGVYNTVTLLRKNTQVDAGIFTELDDYLDKLGNVRTTIEKALKSGQDQEAYNIYKNEYEPLFQESAPIFIKISDSEVQLGDERCETATKTLYISIVILILAVIFSVLITLLVIRAIKKAILTPIQEINTAAQELMQGHFHAKITYESKDELGELAEAMRVLMCTIIGIIKDLDYGLSEIGKGNFTAESKAGDLFVGEFSGLKSSMERIICQLSDTLLNITQASEQVAIGSEQVSGGAQELSQGASEQAASIEEVLTMMNKISEHIQKNAQDANNGKLSAQEVGNLIVQSNELMRQMSDAMDEISSSSSEIGKIIKSIDDIAFQTNILALNAAVEAARAGEAGKGFAVVADEVRNLAGKSAESAKSTAELIENSIHAVSKGVEVMQKTADSLEEVVHKADDVNLVIDEIARTSEEQAASVEQVAQAIDQISQVVQTNSATAEESAAASEELSGQSNFLKSLVAQFEIRGEKHVPKNGFDTEFKKGSTRYEEIGYQEKEENGTSDGKYE